MRKIARNTKPRPSKNTPKPRKSARRRKPGAARKTRAAAPPVPRILPPPPGRGKRGEAAYFGYLLRQAAAASRLTLERALAELGATAPQFVVLSMLKAYPGLSGAELARAALLTPQTVGVIIRNLERDGAIRKTPHPVHGRMLQWTLTRRGLTLLEKCRRHAVALERRLAAGLSRKAELTVRRWLSDVALTLQP